MGKKAEAHDPEERWQSLIEQYGRYLRCVITRLCPRTLGLRFDDIEQEARIRLWQALRKDRVIDDPASYLYRIAASSTIDAVRRVKAYREKPLESDFNEDPLLADMAADGPGVERSTDRKILLEKVQDSMQGLPADRRRIVRLHLQGFTSQEIADLHGWTEAKARNLVYRSLRDLRADLRARGIEYEGD
jgi:RNA polymerase sigma factor (sigma-70 family)